MPLEMTLQYHFLRLKIFSLEEHLQKKSFADILQSRFSQNFANFIEKHLRWRLLLIKLQAWKSLERLPI